MVERALIDYMLIATRMIGRVKDVHVFRSVSTGTMSVHFLAESKVTVAKEWRNRNVVCRREVVKVDELEKLEKKLGYRERLKSVYDRVKEREVCYLEEEWKQMIESLVENRKDMCGTRYVGRGTRKGNEWWNEEVKRKVEEKK